MLWNFQKTHDSKYYETTNPIPFIRGHVADAARRPAGDSRMGAVARRLSVAARMLGAASVRSQQVRDTGRCAASGLSGDEKCEFFQRRQAFRYSCSFCYSRTEQHLIGGWHRAEGDALIRRLRPLPTRAYAWRIR